MFQKLMIPTGKSEHSIEIFAIIKYHPHIRPYNNVNSRDKSTNSCYLHQGPVAPGGETPIWNRRGCSSEILNLTPKGDHPGVAQAFCDP